MYLLRQKIVCWTKTNINLSPHASSACEFNEIPHALCKIHTLSTNLDGYNLIIKFILVQVDTAHFLPGIDERLSREFELSTFAVLALRIGDTLPYKDDIKAIWDHHTARCIRVNVVLFQFGGVIVYTCVC